MAGLGFQLGLQRYARRGTLLNPFKNQIISWLNVLTDTLDTVYNGISPSNAEIEAEADIINGEII